MFKSFKKVRGCDAKYVETTKCDFLKKTQPVLNEVWTDFSMELVLRVNLGPLNELKGLINEVLASDPDRSYLRKEDRISQARMSTRVQQLPHFRQIMKTSLVFPNLFGLKTN